MRAPTHQPKRIHRTAFSLFEVILALAILVVSLGALSQLMSNGVRGSIVSQLETQALLRCQSKLGELEAGLLPLQPTEQTPFEDDPKWTWSLEQTDGPVFGLFNVRVTVAHTGNSTLSEVSVSLTKFMRDAALLRDELLLEQELEALEAEE